jgi:hypothetical protein
MAALKDILGVFSEVGDWIAGAVNDLIPMFYNANPAEGETAGLTFLGVLAVAGLAISVVFLIIGVIQNFLHFRG